LTHDRRSRALPGGLAVSPSPNSPPERSAFGSTAVWLAITILLWLSALLKVHALYAGGAWHNHDSLPRWISLVVIGFETILGLAIILELRPVLTWRVAQLTFGVFCARSLLKALGGENTCGCFGVISVSPYLSVAVNAVILLAIGLIGPPGRLRSVTPGTMHFRLVRSLPALTISLLAILFATAVWQHGPQGLAEAFSILPPAPDGPPTVGKQWPFLDDVKPATNFTQSTWHLLVYRWRCPHCQTAIEAFQREAEALATLTERVRFAIIELPPYEAPQPEPSTLLSLWARAQKGTSVNTPLLVRLDDGIVTSVTNEWSFWQAAGLAGAESHTDRTFRETSDPCIQSEPET
jgi:hypothetical protein